MELHHISLQYLRSSVPVPSLHSYENNIGKLIYNRTFFIIIRIQILLIDFSPITYFIIFYHLLLSTTSNGCTLRLSRILLTKSFGTLESSVFFPLFNQCNVSIVRQVSMSSYKMKMIKCARNCSSHKNLHTKKLKCSLGLIFVLLT